MCLLQNKTITIIFLVQVNDKIKYYLPVTKKKSVCTVHTSNVTKKTIMLWTHENITKQFLFCRAGLYSLRLRVKKINFSLLCQYYQVMNTRRFVVQILECIAGK